MAKAVCRAIGALTILVFAAQPDSARAASCPIAGEYVVAATLVSTGAAAQAEGTFVFTPANECPGSAVGVVDINVVMTRTNGESSAVQLSTGYRIDGTKLTIGEDLIIGNVSGITNGVITSVALVGGASRSSWAA